MGRQNSNGAADEAAKKAKADADAAKAAADAKAKTEADQKAEEKAAADAAKASKKSHTHRVNWTLWRNKKRHLEGSTLALSDEEAAKLGDVVSPL